MQSRYKIPIPIFLCCLLVCSVAIEGCGRREHPKPRQQAAPTLTIGLIPEQNLFTQLDRYEPIAAYLFHKTGIKIKLRVLPRYDNIINYFVSSGMDGAFLGSFTYPLAHAKLGVEILARPENPDGISTYHGLIIVRKDSGIRTVKDMRGKRFAFVDRATTAGYLLPLYYFKRNGVGNYKTYLKEYYFAGTHESAIEDVLNRKADICAAKNTVFERLAKSEERLVRELLILEKSPDVPENGLAVRKDLDPSFKRKLKEALLNMHRDPEGGEALRVFGARRFIETVDADYEPVLKYAREIGLDLSSYDYIND